MKLRENLSKVQTAENKNTFDSTGKIQNEIEGKLVKTLKIKTEKLKALTVG